MVNALPFPVWLPIGDKTAGKAPLWANAAFHALEEEDRARLTEGEGRISIHMGDQSRWFQRHEADVAAFALPCDELVGVEEGLRDLVQTMTQTFALLPLGLAVFDRSRHLASFNPALADLTGLSPAFMSRKPSLAAMLDAMRDRNMVPEPRDWKDWRARVATMEVAGGHGHFSDVWDLPGGQTYRVTGRHHMAGGLVLMFEDISTEVLRGRRYRASLALCQGVIDRMEEAIAVFAVSGQMVLSNTAYASLWGHDPGAGMVKIDLGQVLVHWQSRSAPNALWSELEEFVGLTEARRPWQGEARLHDGRLLRCRCEPLTEGATLVGFQVVQAEGPRRAISAESA